MDYMKAMELFYLISVILMSSFWMGTLAAPSCDTKMDISILLDGSGSICDEDDSDTRLPDGGRYCDNWGLVREFILKITEAFDIAPDKNRLATILFSSSATLLWDLNRYTDNLSLQQAISNIHYPGSDTNTSGALKMAAESIYTPSGGDRSDIVNIVIIITDGIPTFDVETTFPNAIKLREITTPLTFVFAVGITSKIDEETLKQLSSPPQMKNKQWFSSPDFASLEQIQDTVAETVCSITEQTNVEGVAPTLGPVAGGTKITLMGTKLDSPDLEVYIDQMLCSIIERHPMYCIVLSPALTDSEDVNIPLSFILRSSENAIIETTHSFTYKPNPVILDVNTMETILTGGILQEVTGLYLNYVNSRFMEITVIHMRKNTTHPDDYEVMSTTTSVSTPCYGDNSTTMFCITPQLEIPYQFISNPQKRSLPNTKQVIPINNDAMQETGHGHIRRKRQDDEDDIIFGDSEKFLDFRMTFVLDGVLTYQDTYNVPYNGRVRVYPKPTFYTWDDIVVYKISEDNSIRIWGENLDRVVRAADYRIIIGQSLCQHIDLYPNQISCRPPSKEPKQLQKYLPQECCLQVRVHVGYYQVHIGHLRYDKSSILDNDIFKYGLLAGCLFLALLIAGHIVALILYQRQKKTEAHKKDSL